jgi:hypothetical protein
VGWCQTPERVKGNLCRKRDNSPSFLLLLIDKYDDDYPADDRSLQEDCADGLVTVNRCPGNRRWAQLLFDAMIMMPPNASML